MHFVPLLFVPLLTAAGARADETECHRELGQFKEAAHAYRRFLRLASPDSPDAAIARAHERNATLADICFAGSGVLALATVIAW